MSKYTLDELLTLLENEPEKDEVKVKSYNVKQNKIIDEFIKDYDIQPGTNKVPNYYIYHVYFSEWMGASKSRKVNKKAFFMSFSKRFQKHRDGFQRYYLLNDALKYTKEKGALIYKMEISNEKRRKKKNLTKEEQKAERLREERLLKKGVLLED